MTAELNKYIVRNFIAVIDRDGMPSGKEFLSDQFAVSIVGLPSPLDRAGYILYGMAMYEAFSGFKHIIDEITADANRVEVRVHGSGVHIGELLGIPPSGKLITLSAVMIFRLQSGKIVEGWIEIDQQSLLRQIGAYAQMAVAGISSPMKNHN